MSAIPEFLKSAVAALAEQVQEHDDEVEDDGWRVIVTFDAGMAAIQMVHDDGSGTLINIERAYTSLLDPVTPKTLTHALRQLAALIDD
jgi:hypothetical protein